MLIAQISDLHLRAGGALTFERFDTADALGRAIDHINGLDPLPDVTLATGDLTDDGRPEEYQALRAALDRLRMPAYVIPGNHDDRANLRQAFADCGYLPVDGEFLHYTVETWPLRLIGLDTVIPGEIGGGLCSERLAWLVDRLAEQPDRPTLIFMHHPPFPTGIRYMDAPPLEGAAELEAVIRRHAQVRQIVCGHIHRTIAVNWAGTVAAVGPSPVFQMNLTLAPGGRFKPVAEVCAIALYLWENGIGPVSHTSIVREQPARAVKAAVPA